MSGEPGTPGDPLDVDNTQPIDLVASDGMSEAARRDLRIEAWRKRLEYKITGILYARFDKYCASAIETRIRLSDGIFEIFGSRIPDGVPRAYKESFCASVYRKFLESLLEKDPLDVTDALRGVQVAMGVEFKQREINELSQDNFLEMVLAEELARVIGTF